MQPAASWKNGPSVARWLPPGAEHRCTGGTPNERPGQSRPCSRANHSFMLWAGAVSVSDCECLQSLDLLMFPSLVGVLSQETPHRFCSEKVSSLLQSYEFPYDGLSNTPEYSRWSQGGWHISWAAAHDGFHHDVELHFGIITSTFLTICCTAP